MAVRKTTLTIDDAVIDEAKAILGTAGIKDTIDAALAEVLAQRVRLQHIRRLRDMDGLDLDQPDVMAQAWR